MDNQPQSTHPEDSPSLTQRVKEYQSTNELPEEPRQVILGGGHWQDLVDIPGLIQRNNLLIASDNTNLKAELQALISSEPNDADLFRKILAESRYSSVVYVQLSVDQLVTAGTQSPDYLNTIFYALHEQLRQNRIKTEYIENDDHSVQVNIYLADLQAAKNTLAEVQNWPAVAQNSQLRLEELRGIGGKGGAQESMQAVHKVIRVMQLQFDVVNEVVSQVKTFLDESAHFFENEEQFTTFETRVAELATDTQVLLELINNKDLQADIQQTEALLNEEIAKSLPKVKKKKT